MPSVTGRSRGQRLLDVVQPDILDHALGHRALDRAFMQAEHLDVADHVFEAVGGALRIGRIDEGNRSLEAENQCCPRAPEDQIAT